MKDYEINDATMAILPTDTYHSLVLEENLQYEIDQNPLSILNYSCRYFGSSYLGRREGSKNILKSGYKLPIIVDDSRNLVFLPTSSPDEKSCIWIALNKIKSISKTDDGYSGTIVEFQTGKKITVDISYKSLENQILRASCIE